MKKKMILGAFMMVTCVSIGSIKDKDSFDCPGNCDGSVSVCCKTSSGTTYYGSCSCN